MTPLKYPILAKIINSLRNGETKAYFVTDQEYQSQQHNQNLDKDNQALETLSREKLGTFCRV